MRPAARAAPKARRAPPLKATAVAACSETHDLQFRAGLVQKNRKKALPYQRPLFGSFSTILLLRFRTIVRKKGTFCSGKCIGTAIFYRNSIPTILRLFFVKS